MQTLRLFLFTLHKILSYILSRPKRYLQGTEKPVWWQVIELAGWLVRSREYHYHYHAFGLNLKGAKQGEYISRREILALRSQAGAALAKQLGSANLNWDIVTKDKFFASAIFEVGGIAAIPVKGLISNGKLFINRGKEADIGLLYRQTAPFVLKNALLEAGEGFLLCEQEGDLLKVNGETTTREAQALMFGRGRWVWQERVVSHQAIRQMNDTALNTTRIVTILDGGQPRYLCGFQAFATAGATIDSWGGGALYVGFDPEEEKLKEVGYYHPAIVDKTLAEHHPDSGIRFAGYAIPYVQEAVQLCLRGHALLSPQFIIGWDVAITDQGPLVVEANERPGMNAVQCIDGGLRSEIRACFARTMRGLGGQNESFL